MRSFLPIAVVDDDRSVRASLVTLLRSHGFVVEDFDSAEQFVEAFGAGKFGCLLSDIQMPGMSGIELVRWLDDRGIDLPVVLMTAEPEERQAALALGTEAVLLKPFACDALAGILRRVMRPSP